MGPLSSADPSRRAPPPHCCPPPRDVSPKRGLEPCGQAWMSLAARLPPGGPTARRLPSTARPSLTPASTPLLLSGGTGWGLFKAGKEREENTSFWPPGLGEGVCVGTSAPSCLQLQWLQGLQGGRARVLSPPLGMQRGARGGASGEATGRPGRSEREEQGEGQLLKPKSYNPKGT